METNQQSAILETMSKEARHERAVAIMKRLVADKMTLSGTQMKSYCITAR